MWSQPGKDKDEVVFEHLIFRCLCDFEEACPSDGWKNKTGAYERGKMGMKDLEIIHVEVAARSTRAEGSLWSSEWWV